MKNLLLSLSLTVLATGLLFTSCSKDDESIKQAFNYKGITYIKLTRVTTHLKERFPMAFTGLVLFLFQTELKAYQEPEMQYILKCSPTMKHNSQLEPTLLIKPKVPLPSTQADST